MRDVFPILSGNANIQNEGDLIFTKLDSIANGTIVNAKPDFYDGARFVDVDLRVRQDLGSFIIHTGHARATV